LEDLRGFLGAPAGSMDNIDSVDLKFQNVWSIYSPHQNVQENFASALKDADCVRLRDRNKMAMVVRSVVADVTLKFTGRSLTKHGAEAFVSQTDPAPHVSNDGAFFTVTLARRLVALKLAPAP
jgi:hypothetical protein